MTITEQNRGLWTELYTAAVAFRDLKPWEWLHDTDLFAVADPATGERQYCCVMGNAGEVFALAVYPGPEGLASYQVLLDAAEEGTPAIEEGLEQRALMVQFEDRDQLTDADRKQIKALDLKFRGAKQWVQFRRHDPAYLPWYIGETEAARLLPVLRQAALMAKEIREDTDAYLEADECPLRLQRDGAWRTAYEPWPELPTPAPLPVDPARVEAVLAEVPQVEGALLLGSTYLPSGVLPEDSARPYFARIALWLHYPSGTVLYNDLFEPEELEERFADWFLDSLRELEAVPKQVGLNSRRLHGLLTDLAEALGIQLLYIPDEPAFEEVFAYLLGQMEP